MCIEQVGDYTGLTSTAGFQFPLLEDPQSVIAGILLGQTKTMFSYSTGRQHFELAPSLTFGIEDIIGISLKAGVIFDANLTMGYDTAGLLKLIQDPSHDPADLLHGFYFDNSLDTDGPSTYTDPITGQANQPIRKTGLYLHGLAEIDVSAGVTVSGGLFADISVGLKSLDTGSHVALDSIVTGLGSNAKVFAFAGKVYASADLSLTIPNPIGPDITLFTYNLAYDELLNFNPPSAQSGGPPPVIIDVTNQHTLLLDVTKMGVGSRIVSVQPFHDLSITAGSITYVGAGIEVDYPNERYLYVEMKDGAISDYYNLIGLSGATPDAASIQIVDPFRVFFDEDVPNPDPTLATPGVVLAGGKNVVYRYNDAFDGTHAKVLLVGGYGSNTLAGGTMEFGNFIPADRMATAQAHVNVPLGGSPSGFDVNAHNLIASQISDAVAPASPSGIIGATMSAGRGGLMFGGPGNNSFFAAGAGDYEMIGGNWVNSFNISPSFSGGNATYQIDGGGGASGMVVRVPAGGIAEFENGTVPDRYNPAFKALDIFNSSGLFATAHGIQTVQAVGSPGSAIVFGDTSELDSQFKVKGSGTLKFVGTSASDAFDVSAEYDPVLAGPFFDTAFRYVYHGTKHHRSVMTLRPRPSSVDDLDNLGGLESAFQNVVMFDRTNAIDELGRPVWLSPHPPLDEWPYIVAVPSGANAAYPDFAFPPDFHWWEYDLWYPITGSSYDFLYSRYFDGPFYDVTRTYGTNGRTQSILFELEDADRSSIVLDGRGASDDYHIGLGLGNFLDITINDSDTTTQNTLEVDFQDTQLLADRAVLTDNSLQVEYFTRLDIRSVRQRQWLLLLR